MNLLPSAKIDDNGVDRGTVSKYRSYVSGHVDPRLLGGLAMRATLLGSIEFAKVEVA